MAVRNGLLGMGLLQGLLLLGLMHSGLEERSWQALVVLLIVQPPLFMAMAVTRWRDARLWAGGAVMALVVVLMVGTVIWGVEHSPYLSDSAFFRLAIALSLWWFVALPWFQGYLSQGRWRVPYAQLFVLAWNNALVLALAALCVHLVWGVLWLGAGLFALVGVMVFVEVFSSPSFFFVLTGLLGGAGLWLARTQQRPIQMMLQTLLALGHLLLPLLSWVLVFFVLALVFTGLQGLWDTQLAAGLLMGVLLVQIWVVNAVYQDGVARRGPYARMLLWLVHASLVVMPVLASLACIAIGLRVQQYGWTAERVWAAAGAGVLWLYAVGYAVAAVHGSLQSAPSRPWLQAVAPVNQWISLLVLALLLALQTPVLDGQRIGAASQRDRLLANAADVTREHLNDLKFDHGPYGVAALQSLVQEPGFQPAQPRKLLEEALATSEPLADESGIADDADLVDAATARARIPTPQGMQVASDDWWDWLLTQAHENSWARQCLRSDADCVLLSGDWDQDQKTDHLLCDLDEATHQSCQLSARDAQGKWHSEGEVAWSYTHTALADIGTRDLLRAGRINVQRLRWPDWQLPYQDENGAPNPLTGMLERRHD